jgi:hypothetical protein
MFMQSYTEDYCVGVTSHKSFVTYFMVLKLPLLQLMNKYTTVVFMQVVRVRVSFSDVCTRLKFRTLICIKVF